MKNCPQCWLRECDCSCATCAAARERRKTLTPEDERALALGYAMTARVETPPSEAK